MPKRKRTRIALTEPDDIIAAASRRPLSPNEIAELAGYIDNIERQLSASADALARLQLSHRETINNKFLGIGLDHDGALLLQFPDQHTCRIPVGLLQADNALAMVALLSLLRERQKQTSPKYIGTAAAPTQHDLQVLLRQSATAVTLCPASGKARRPAPSDLSLDDLDLDFF